MFVKDPGFMAVDFKEEIMSGPDAIGSTQPILSRLTETEAVLEGTLQLLNRLNDSLFPATPRTAPEGPKSEPVNSLDDVSVRLMSKAHSIESLSQVIANQLVGDV